AVVEHAAGARGGAELDVVDADAVLVGPEYVLGADARLARVVGDQPAEGVARQPRDPRRRVAQPRQADRGVQLGPADEQVQAAGLLQAAEVRRAQSHHRFPERNDLAWHASLLKERRKKTE